MRNLFALVGAGTLTFVGLGWYLDWYRLARQPSPAGTQRLQVDLNADKITGDVKKGIERGGEIIDHLRDEKGQSNQSAPTNNGAASQFFSPSSSDTTGQPASGSGWKSLDSSPPPPITQTGARSPSDFPRR
jgi:hypothetical protein